MTQMSEFQAAKCQVVIIYEITVLSDSVIYVALNVIQRIYSSINGRNQIF